MAHATLHKRIMILRADQRGAVLLFTVLVIGLSAVAMMAALAVSGLNSFTDSYQHVSSVRVRANLLGCVNELLIQLNENPDFSPLILPTGDATCSVAVVNEGGNDRSADLLLTQGNITRSVHVEMVVNGVQLVSLVEE